ncbi:MAG: S8 family peptidase [Muribaculaceae bacterium]|nr:S8 family peptidase [Muribaculaceae bacterium]
MKKISVLILAGVALLANAQNKIDFAGRLAIEKFRDQQKSETGLIAPMAAGSAVETYSVIVEFNDEEFDYGDVAVEELSRVANMSVVTVTAAQMEQLAALPNVKNISLGSENKPMMYFARPAGKVDAVQTGADGLGTKYTGKGIITGLYDVGLDINHINFLNADGSSRAKSVWHVETNRVTSYTTATQIKGFRTEDEDETHATHVLGIMSGSYTGPATYGVLKDDKAVLVKQDEAGSAIPFYGVATDAEIVAACGRLTDACIATGMQKMVDYAKNAGKPCVLNLSIGSTIGPHDGSEGVAKYLSELGKDAIICIAAGNEGGENISISTKGKTIKTFVTPIGPGSGQVQFWASDNKTFTVRFIGYDRSKSKEVFSYTLDKNLEGGSVSQRDMEGFNGNMTGSITMSSNISTANNRYNVAISMNVSGATSSITPAFVIEPVEGQTVDGYGNNMQFLSQSVAGFTNGNDKNSINNMACGKNVIVVGAYTTAASWASISDDRNSAVYQRYSGKPAVGYISAFSSYGKNFEGKQLPDVCAPGEGIISSFSNYYVAKHPDVVSGWLTGEYAAPKAAFSRNSPWGLMQGTSMACPFVAGVAALWLQADPTLTVAEVMDIINTTSVKDLSTTAARARFGAGKIDALAGIKAVIARSGINDIKADSEEAFVTSTDGRNFEIFVPGAGHVNAQLYSLSGLCVANATADGENAVLSADNATAGVYVLKIDSGKNSETRKIVIK